MRFFRLALVALAAALPITAAAPAAEAKAAYLHQFNACGVDPGVYVTYGYGPSNYGPPADTALYHERQAQRDEFIAIGQSQGLNGGYMHGRLIIASRFNDTTVYCSIRHRSSGLWGYQCDYDYTVTGADTTFRSISRSSKSCYFAATD